MDNTRKQQLRLAKQRQRARERQAGYDLYQVRLEAHLIKKLKIGMRDPEFVEQFSRFLESEIIDIRAYPNLNLVAWNRHQPLMTRQTAFRLYERNWRLLSSDDFDVDERDFLDELKSEFGRGVISG